MGRRGDNGIAGGCVVRRRTGEALQIGDTLIVVTKLSETRVSIRVFSTPDTAFKRLDVQEAIAAMQQRSGQSTE